MAIDQQSRFIEQVSRVGSISDHDAAAHELFLRGLEEGRLRAAEPKSDGGWRVNSWVKEAILASFRISDVVEFEGGAVTSAFDKASFPPRFFSLDDRVRLVPGGSAVRRGAHLAAGVVVMPPAYVNVGAWVGKNSMIDSHALVGSCAQVGQRVHISAGAQIGGVLEPISARPVIVEDDVFIGGQVGLFDGTLVRRRAVIAAGVTITGSTIIYDLVRERELRCEVPENAVVVPGARQARGRWAGERGLALQTAVIVKYRDRRTDAATALEGALR